MKIHRVYAIFLRQFYLLRRSTGRMFGVFYWSTVELVLWGFITIYLNKVGVASFNFATVLLGAVLFWEFFHRSQQALSVSYLEDMWTRNFANLFASPLKTGEYLAGLIVTSIFNTALTVLWTSFLAFVLFHFNVFQYGLLLVPFVLLVFVFGWCLGILTTAIVLRLGSSGEIFAWSIPFLIQPFSAVFYPVSSLPAWLQPISRFIPLTPVFEGMRAVVLRGEFDSGSLFSAAILTVIFFFVSVAIFAAVFRHARRKGYLVRFTTE